MDKMTRPQLLALAKERGFTRYSKFNKHDLIRLIRYGKHPDPIPTRLYGIIVDGTSIDKLFTPYDHMHKYSVSDRLVQGGYIVNGVNLEGLFNSSYVPDRVEMQEEIDYPDTDNEDDEPVTVMRNIVIRGGWFVPHADFPTYRQYINDLRTAASLYQPRSLFELAARIVNTRRQTAYLPKIIKQKLKEYK